MTPDNSEDDFLDFNCPQCGQLNSFPRDSIGRLWECLNCLESLIVPEVGSKAGRMLPIPITTPRLILRRFEANDWKDMMELVSDDEFLIHTDGLAVQGSDLRIHEEGVLNWLERDRQVKLTSENQTFRLAIVERKDGGKLMGYVRLYFTDSERLQATLGITLHLSYQRKGFGFEAASSLLGFCFDGINLHRVTFNCDSRNTAASLLCGKLRMRREAEFVKDYSFDGVWRNSVWYAVLQEEYRQDRGHSR